MKRPPGRRPAEPRRWLYELLCQADSWGQADSWDKLRRVILVVKERPDDLLFDRFFLVTSLDWTEKTRREVLAPNLPANGAANAARPRATWAS